MISNVRKVLPEQIGIPVRRFITRRIRLRRSSLGRSDRAVRDALGQINSGIPLNWTQVEDDPALQVLAFLSEKKDLTSYRGDPHSPELPEELYRSLSARLPAPKAQPVKEAVKPLAGFSEEVPVLTQAEEDVPSLSINFAAWIRNAVVVAFVGLLAFWAFSNFVGSGGPTPKFRWIDLWQNGQQVSKSVRPAGTTLPECGAFKIEDPNVRRDFSLAVPYRDVAQQSVGFTIDFLPATLPISPTYTFKLLDSAISSCTADVADPADTGAMLKMNYAARQNLGRGGYTSGTMSVYEGQAVPLPIQLPTGGWKEVNIGPAHGIFWKGGPFVDIGGTSWIGDVSVLAIENGDKVALFVGPAQSGITEEMLTSLVTRMQQGSDTTGDQNSAHFHWIEVRQNGQVISPNALGKDWTPPSCSYSGRPNYNIERTYERVTSLPQARSYTGYDLLSLPTSAANPFTYTTQVIEGGVRPCAGSNFVSADPGSAVKLRYTLKHAADGTSHTGEIDLFQWYDLPASIDVANGLWKTERVGDWQAIFWSGSNYHDPEGSDWSHDVGVLVAERDRTVVTLIGRVDEGTTEDLLLTLLGQLTTLP